MSETMQMTLPEKPKMTKKSTTPCEKVVGDGEEKVGNVDVVGEENKSTK